jgi:hypothetical protein
MIVWMAQMKTHHSAERPGIVLMVTPVAMFLDTATWMKISVDG